MSEQQEDTFLGEVRLGRQLTSIGQVTAVGMTIMLGLVVLLSGPAVRLTGSRAPVMEVLTSVVLGLTLLSVVELIGGSGEHGGTYVLVDESLGGLPAFLTGLSVLAGSLAVTAALVLAAADALLLVLPLAITPTLLALALLAALFLIQLFQFLPRRLQLRTVGFFLSAVLVLVLVTDLGAGPAGLLRAERTLRTGQAALAITWLSAAYIAFESILAVRRQVRQPGRLLPAAILQTLLIGTALFIIVLFILGRLGLRTGSPAAAFTEIVASSSFLPFWAVDLAVVAVLILTAYGTLMTAGRQVYAMSRQGALPRVLRRVWKPFPMPVLLFLVLALISVPMLLWDEIETLVYISSGLFLLAMTGLNAAAIQSHRTEPERRRPFLVPFTPLVPLIAIAANLVLLRFLPSTALLLSAGWLLLGTLLYFAYARGQQVTAQEGEVVFGSARKTQPTRQDVPRILIPIGPAEERHMLLNMATALARQRNAEVIPLQVIVVPDPLAIEEGRRTARERNTLFRWSMRAADAAGVPVYPITRLARSVQEGIIDTAVEEHCDLILIPWGIRDGRQGPTVSRVLSYVSRHAPCDVAVVSYHRGLAGTALNADGKGEEAAVDSGKDGKGAGFQPSNILVPTSGGPNAPLAIQLALLWAREFEAKVTAIYVSGPDATDGDQQLGERRIEETIARMREMAKEMSGLPEDGVPLEEIPIEGQVVTASSVVEGIAQTGSEYSLVMLGASEESLIDQVLFGSIPEQVAQDCSSPVIIVRHYQGLPRQWLRRLGHALYAALPKLNAEEQIEVYRGIHRGARPDVDFFIMIGLSTIIATYGLFQNSGAVIIGAMLVAPLFSPLIALSLSIAQGNIRLLRLAVEANLKGMTLAIGLAIVLAFISPFDTLTPEILARSQPTLQDLIVALASGAAGAYAMARKDVAAALPGVAIAAALVPPLGVVGVGLAFGDFSVASGSFLLFVTNLVAIVLAGALIFLLLGFRPGRQGERAVHLRRGLLAAIVLFVLITIPLGLFFVRSVETSRTRLTIENHLIERLEALPELEVVDTDEIGYLESEGVIQVTLPVYARETPGEELIHELDAALSEAVSQPVHVRLVLYPLLDLPPTPTPEAS